MNNDYSTPEPLHMPSPAETAAEMMGGHKPHASPAVRAFASELGVDLTLLQGSGPNGRITFDDVKAYVRSIVKPLTTET
jgi:pyruvate dehydrogenase E2 component (dihydrolipoamide acetyltransferase)